ncbi:MAG: hypothetical protein GY720_05315 [bacterium]|nr:hypothetical protein [bacterium]
MRRLLVVLLMMLPACNTDNCAGVDRTVVPAERLLQAEALVVVEGLAEADRYDLSVPHVLYSGTIVSVLYAEEGLELPGVGEAIAVDQFDYCPRAGLRDAEPADQIVLFINVAGAQSRRGDFSANYAAVVGEDGALLFLRDGRTIHERLEPHLSVQGLSELDALAVAFAADD